MRVTAGVEQAEKRNPDTLSRPGSIASGKTIGNPSAIGKFYYNRQSIARPLPVTYTDQPIKVSHRQWFALGMEMNPHGGHMLYLSRTRIVGESLNPCGCQLAFLGFITCL